MKKGVKSTAQSANDSGMDIADKTKPARKGLLFRAKKYLASKTAGTRSGQRYMNSALGKEASDVADAITGVASRVCGRKEAKDAQDDVYRLAAKAALLLENRVLTAENTKHAEIPLRNLGIQVLDALSSADSDVRMSKLSTNAARIKALIGDIMKPHLTPKNYAKLMHVFDLYGGAPFLTALLRSKDFATNKKRIFDALSALLPEQAQALQKKREMSRKRPCAAVASGCRSAAVHQQGQFLGSRFCPYHHLIICETRTQRPKLESFIADSEMAPYLYIFLTKNRMDLSNAYPKRLVDTRPVSYFQFARAVAAYRHVDRKLRRKRAESIIQRYLCATAPVARVSVSAGRLENVSRVMATTGDVENTLQSTRYGKMATFDAPPKSLFDDALADVHQTLEIIFRQEFLKSSIFQMYLRTVSLPPYYRRLAEAELKRRKSKGTSAHEEKAATTTD